LAIPPPARVFVAVECNFELPLPPKVKLHAEIALQRDTAELWSGRDDDANA
jgi:hypothetical protein